MKIVGAIIVVILAILLCILACKVACWIFDFDKKSDRKLFGVEIEDYDNDKVCAIASIIVVFAVITGWVLYLLLTRW